MSTRLYFAGKVLQAIATLLFVIVFNFFLFRVMPGDPVKLLTRGQGLRLSQQEQDALVHDLGLDQPLPQQFVTYVGDVVRGNLGVSYMFAGQSVSGLFVQFLWPTLLLVGVSTIASTLIGILMGIYSGWRRGSAVDVGSMTTSLVFYSMPEFWLGIILLIVFSSYLGLFPTGGLQSVSGEFSPIARVTDYINHLFLPALTLTLAYVGEYYLVMRSSLLDVLGEDYVLTARAKGLREKFVLRRHAVRNAMLPTVTIIAINFGFVIGGAITVETVFSYPGLGLLTFDALQAKDYPLLQGTFLFFSVAVIAANLVADLLYGYLDPRVREA
jgi:peptide/nickel transport system permease protein